MKIPFLRGSTPASQRWLVLPLLVCIRGHLCLILRGISRGLSGGPMYGQALMQDLKA